MENNRVNKVRPFCSPSGKNSSIRTIRPKQQPPIAIKSVAEWERVFTSRKRTLLQKACDLDAITNCTIALCVASPYGGVWYYASNDAVKMRLSAAGLINNESMQVTMDSLSKDVITENFKASAQKQAISSAQNMTNTPSGTTYPLIQQPPFIFQRFSNLPMQNPFAFSQQEQINPFGTIPGYSPYSSFHNQFPTTPTPPGNNSDSGSMSQGTDKAKKIDASEIKTQMPKESTIHVKGSNSSSSSSSSDSDSDSSSSNESDSENMNYKEMKKNPKEPIKPLSKPVSLNANTSSDKKQVVVKKEPMSISSSSESSSSESSSDDDESDKMHMPPVNKKSPKSIAKSNRGTKTNKNKSISTPVIDRKPVVVIEKLQNSTTKNALTKNTTVTAGVKRKAQPNKINNTTPDTPNKHLKFDSCDSETETDESDTSTTSTKTNSGNKSTETNKFTDGSKISEAIDNLNISSDLKKIFTLFMESEKKESSTEPPVSATDSAFKRKTKKINNSNKKSKQQADKTKASKQATIINKENSNNLKSNKKTPKPEAGKCKAKSNNKPKVPENNSNDSKKDDELNISDFKLKESTRKSERNEKCNKDNIGKLVSQIKTSFESVLSQKNLSKHRACHKFVTEKEELNKRLFIPALLRHPCFKETKDMLSSFDLTKEEKKELFTKALSGCKSLTINKSGTTLQRVGINKKKPEKNAKTTNSTKPVETDRPKDKQQINVNIKSSKRKKEIFDKKSNVDAKTKLNESFGQFNRKRSKNWCEENTTPTKQRFGLHECAQNERYFHRHKKRQEINVTPQKNISPNKYTREFDRPWNKRNSESDNHHNRTWPRRNSDNTRPNENQKHFQFPRNSESCFKEKNNWNAQHRSNHNFKTRSYSANMKPVESVKPTQRSRTNFDSGLY